MREATIPSKTMAHAGPVVRLAIALSLIALLHATPGCAGTHRPAEEADRVTNALRLAPGTQIADVGAGNGEFSEELARVIGEKGHIFATEVDEDDLDDIERRLESVGLSNYTVVLGTDEETGLPDDCCDAVLLRLVYHHFTEPETMRKELLRSIKPGGLIAVIEIEPQVHWGKLSGVPDRGGHGIGMDELIEEMSPAGFEVVERYATWETDENDTYCVVFRTPASP